MKHQVTVYIHNSLLLFPIIKNHDSFSKANYIIVSEVVSAVPVYRNRQNNKFQPCQPSQTNLGLRLHVSAIPPLPLQCMAPRMGSSMACRL